MRWIKRADFLVTIGLIAGAALALSAGTSFAARRHHRKGTHHAARRAAPVYRGALLEEAETGRILYQENAGMEWPPASMAKMMLMLVAEEEIEAGKIKRTDLVRISERSAMTGGSRLGLREGSIYPLGELMKAALIRSANDAAVAIAEKIAGSVEACVRLMNAHARKLGLTHTHYNTVDGLPPRPGRDVDVTNAYDLAALARNLIKHPALLELSGSEQALFDGGPWILHNTNHLIGHFDGCDGLKTGFTYHAGFNLTATARRGDMRLVAVVLGAPSNAQRFAQAARLMNWGFANFTKIAFFKQGQMIPVRVRLHDGVITQPVTVEGVEVVVPKQDAKAVRIDYEIPSAFSEPLEAGNRVGDIVVRDGTVVLTRVAAICLLQSPPASGLAEASADAAAVAVASDGSAEDHKR